MDSGSRRYARLIKRVYFAVLVLVTIRLVVPFGGLIGSSDMALAPAWFEWMIAALGAVGILAAVVAMLASEFLPWWVKEASAVLLGFCWVAVGFYVILAPHESVFLSRWGLFFSDLGLGVLGLAGWRVLRAARLRDQAEEVAVDA